jgi:hypothetical protein
VYDSWPAWLYALPSFDATWLRIFSSKASLDTLPSELLPGNSVEFCELDHLKHGLMSPLPDWILGQGSWSFFMSTPLGSLTTPKILFVIDDSDQQEVPLDPPWSSLSLTHAECGGVLEGSWRVLCNFVCARPSEAVVPVLRTLTHVVDPTTTRSGPDKHTKFVTPLPLSARLPATRLSDAVLCPTVYPSRPWEARPLSFRESGRVLDLPSRCAITSWDHPACLAAPAKVLYTAYHICRGGGLRFGIQP